MGKRIDIESHDTLKITLAERVPNNLDFTAIIKELNQIVSPRLEKQGYSSVEVIPRMDNKLKDYLEHSQKKFPSGDSYFNILVISLEILQDMDEWYGYLLGDNGAFTPNSYIKTCYDNVDAVLLCTPICGLKGWKHYSNINVWKLEETLNLLFLDPRKECIKGQDQLTEKGKFYRDYGMYMFGALTEPFLLFQQKLDSENEGKFAKLSFQERYIAFKEKDIRICSAFVENLIEQQSSAL